MKRILNLCLFVVLLAASSRAQTNAQKEYQKLQLSLSSGWNTWNTHSVISHVKLPEGIALNLWVKNQTISGHRLLHEAYISNKEPRPDTVVPGYHSYDGSYTECTVHWLGMQLKVETAHEGNDLLMLLTPVSQPRYPHRFVVQAAMLWNMPGTAERMGNNLLVKTAKKQVQVYATQQPVEDALTMASPYLVFDGDKTMGVCTGKQRSLAEMKAGVLAQRNAFVSTIQKQGSLAETRLVQQSVLAWNMIYDPQLKAVIAPVSRVWNTFFGGHYVLFDWDTYLSGLMAGYDNKALAYANVVEVTKTVDKWGIVPNYVSAHGFGSPDRSQPPVGSMVIHYLYEKYKDHWLLEINYERLLQWNRWWPKRRDTKGFLCWGSDKIPPDASANTWQAAAYESGLDNSPMYDGVPFDTSTHQMALADVGLMSLYIADCKYLARTAQVLNKAADAKELLDRADCYSKKLQELWHEPTGMFLNRRTDNGAWSFRLSPTLFYPLLAGVASPQQAERMIKEHLLNEKEFWGEWVLPAIARNDSAFHEQDYWRGRIWAPLNFLVYMGLKQYPFPEATRLLAEKSNALLLKNWRQSRGVFENYHSSGVGRLPNEAINRSDNFYHWGGLLGYMHLLESSNQR